MFNSVFLFIMLLAFKHTHLISDLDVFPCIPLHLLYIAFFDKPPCPTSLNIVLYPSHWQPPLTVPRQKRQPPSTKVQTVPHVTIFRYINKKYANLSFIVSMLHLYFCRNQMSYVTSNTLTTDIFFSTSQCVKMCFCKNTECIRVWSTAFINGNTSQHSSVTFVQATTSTQV